MTIIDALRAEFEYDAKQVTAKIMQAIPEDKLAWKPHEKSMTLGRLAGHINEIPTWGASIVTTDKLEFDMENYKPVTPKTKAGIIDEHRKNAHALLDVMGGQDDAYMMQPWALIASGQTFFEMPRIVVFRNMVLNHKIHHRGQMTVYLRLVGAPVPSTIGPSADDMPGLG